MHAGRPVPPIRDGEYGPRQAAGSYKNLSVIHFWFSFSTLHVSGIILQAVLLKEDFKVENKEKKFSEWFLSQSLINADVVFYPILHPHWLKHTSEMSALTFAAFTVPRTPSSF